MSSLIFRVYAERAGDILAVWGGAGLCAEPIGDGAAALANFSTPLALTGNNFSYMFRVFDDGDRFDADAFSRDSGGGESCDVYRDFDGASALGAENGSSNGLKFTWSATGPAGVTYTGATNGTKCGEEYTANFTQRGFIIFR